MALNRFSDSFEWRTSPHVDAKSIAVTDASGRSRVVHALMSGRACECGLLFALFVAHPTLCPTYRGEVLARSRGESTEPLDLTCTPEGANECRDEE